jgi:hypothetical protein
MWHEVKISGVYEPPKIIIKNYYSYVTPTLPEGCVSSNHLDILAESVRCNCAGNSYVRGRLHFQWEHSKRNEGLFLFIYTL